VVRFRSMIVKNIKTTREDRRYFDEKGRMKEAAEQGKLGKSYFFRNPATGKDELRPRRIIKRV